MANTDARRWQEAAAAWVERGPMALLGDGWIDDCVQAARDRMTRIDSQLEMLRKGRAELERVGDRGAELLALDAKIESRNRDRERVDVRHAVLERLRRLSRSRQPESVRRWRIGCVARVDRAPVALADLAGLDWVTKGPSALVEVVTQYVEHIRAVGTEAEVAVARANARRALVQSADDTSEMANARVALELTQDALIPLLLDAMAAEVEFCRRIQQVRSEVLAPLNLTPPRATADDVALVPERLWVRLVLVVDHLPPEMHRRAKEMLRAWPAWLRRLHDAGDDSLGVDGTLQLYIVRPDADADA